ncbi:MAG: MFS transporter [Erysipelotrichaceae bacterium]|nr:MFS transporter [Erysipelotrichaceae bacterium]
MRKQSVQRAFFLWAMYSLVANFAHPITPTFIQDLGLRDYMFGVAFACMAITNFAFSPFWGKISKSIGASRLMGICFLGYAFAQAVFGSATTELQIAIGRLIGGFFIGGITVNQILYIMENSAPGKAGQNLATNVTVNVVVAAFGYMMGGFLGNISIPMTFMVQVAGLTVNGILYWVLLKDADIERNKLTVKEVVANSNPFQAVVDAKVIMTYAIAMFLVVCLSTQFATTCYEQCFNYFIKDQYGFPPSYNGLLKAAVGVITMIANSTICVYLMKKTNIFKSLIPVLSICFAMMMSIVVLDKVVPFIIMNVVFFGFNAVYQPLIQAMISKLSDKDDGIMVGLFNSMRSLGMVGGSLFAGFIYEVGPKLSFVFSAMAFLIAIVATFAMNRKMKYM